MRHAPPIRLLLGLFASFLAAATPMTAAAQTCKVTRNWAPVVELYTSEGCSSCPPADAWLRSLAASAAQHQVVPLAFHVDYWDYLGWRDPFSQGSHSSRQRQLARAEGGTVVYTPQVRLAGEDFRGWRSTTTVQSMLDRNTPKPDGEVELALEVRDRTLRIDSRALLPASAVAYVAIYERKLGTTVSGGENAGRTLEHDFVVRRLIGPFAPDARGRLALRQDVTLETGWKRGNLGMALVQADARSGAARLGAALTLCDAQESLSAPISSAPHR